MNIKHLLPPRLQEWYAIGPVQRAELEQFAQALLDSQAVGVTCDGCLVEPGTQVWVLDGIGSIKPATVQKSEALTNYYLFGPIPVSHAWLNREQLERYKRDR